MVSNRCKMAVKEELKKLGLHFIVIDLGEVDIMENISMEKRSILKANLLHSGLELMDDKKAMLIEKIKNIIIDMVHYSDENIKVNFSNYLSEKMNHDYTYLSNLFSEVQGTTIEHFIISHKIERIKELIIYGNTILPKSLGKWDTAVWRIYQVNLRRLQDSRLPILNNSKIKDEALLRIFNPNTS